MKKIILKMLMLIGIISISQAQNNWIQQPNFPGGARSAGISFSLDSDGDGINDKGYVGLGWDLTTNYQDIWEYEPTTGQWTQIANYPGSARRSITTIEHSNKAYIIGGAIGNNSYTQEVWEFDPTNSSWTQLTSFPGSSRFGTIAFSIGNFIYYGFGNSGNGSNPNHTTDFWRFDPVNNSWSTVANFPGIGRVSGAAFAIDVDGDGINDRGFMGTGKIIDSFGNDQSSSDIWEYDVTNDTWIQRADFPNETVGSLTFSIDGIGYFGFGASLSGIAADLYQYNTGSDSWSQVLGFNPTHPRGGLAFAFEDSVFLIGGQQGVSTVTNEVWAYIPPLSGPNVNSIYGLMFDDLDSNCAYDSTDFTLSGWVVKAEPGPYYAVTNNDGEYTILVDSGSYQVTYLVPSSIDALVTPACVDSTGFSLSFSGYGNDTSGLAFANYIESCPLLQVQVASNRRRRCFTNSTQVEYCNIGFDPLDSVQIILEYPEFLTIVSADAPFTYDGDSNYVFNIGYLGPNQCGDINIVDSVLCDSVGILGLTQCITAKGLPENTCLPPDTAWNNASVEVSGLCTQNNDAFFTIENTGSGDMTDSTEFRVYADQFLAFSANVKLTSGESITLLIPASGPTIRLEVDQVPNHPTTSLVSATVEACTPQGTSVSQGFVNQFPLDDEALNVDIDCLPIIGSWDPNDKMVFPEGTEEQGYVLPGTRLNYQIRFQNTGTDTAFSVIVIDTLSENLDISTLTIGPASHQFEYEVTGRQVPVLRFLFNNISLPDSGTNNLGSQGYIKFSIDHIPDLALWEEIENNADIYFDFNPPIRTNTTLNTLGSAKLVDEDAIDTVIINPPTAIVPISSRELRVSLYPNPTTNVLFADVRTENDELLQFELYDLQGKQLWFDNNVQTGVSRFDLPTLTPGMYFIRISNERGLLKTSKLVIK